MCRPVVHPIHIKVPVKDLNQDESRWIGETIKGCLTVRIRTQHDDRYAENGYSVGPAQGNPVISLCLEKGSNYTPSWMYEAHKEWLKPLTVCNIDKVAIITPTLTRRKNLLAECITSISEQDWAGEVLQCVGYDLKKEGPSKVRNRIVKSIDPSYKWLAFVDDDDLLFPNHISTLVSCSYGADIVYSDSKEEGFIKDWISGRFDYEELKKENYIPITVLMRRSMFEKVGGYIDDPPGEDQRLWLRCALEGARFRYVPKVTWIYRQHPQHREKPQFTLTTEIDSTVLRP